MTPCNNAGSCLIEIARRNDVHIDTQFTPTTNKQR